MSDSDKIFVEKSISEMHSVEKRLEEYSNNVMVALEGKSVPTHSPKDVLNAVAEASELTTSSIEYFGDGDPIP